MILNHIKISLNRRRQNQRTIVVALDLSKAFDTVNHSILLQDIYNSTLQAYIEFRSKTSKFRKVKQGGRSLISRTLQLLYVADQPRPPERVEMITYAGDCSLLGSNTDPHASFKRSIIPAKTLRMAESKMSPTLTSKVHFNILHCIDSR